MLAASVSVPSRAAQRPDSGLRGAPVDGHGQIARPSSCGWVSARRWLQPGTASDRNGHSRASAGRGEIDHQHVDRAVGLGLQDELAVDLERRAEHCGQGHRFGKQPGNGRRIVVAGEDIGHHGPEPHQPAAHAQGLDMKRQTLSSGAGRSATQPCVVQSRSLGLFPVYRCARSRSIRCTETPGKNALLHVQTVFRLVEHHRLRPVDHLVGHFLASIGGKAMHEYGTGRRRLIRSASTL